jgi:hypothetical protein
MTEVVVFCALAASRKLLFYFPLLSGLTLRQSHQLSPGISVFSINFLPQAFGFGCSFVVYGY